MKRKRLFAVLPLLFCILLNACGSGQAAKNMFSVITQEKAKALMDSGADFYLLDVRTAEEFTMGHIAGAHLLPYDEISADAPDNPPDKAQTILVYCRSGRRSKIAAEALANLGYTDVREFGGILDWPFETVSGSDA